MTQIDTYIPSSFIAIFAHPDDIEFGCAGTLAKWIKAGARARYVIVTSGDVGVARDGVAAEGMTRAKAAAIREAETTAAAHAIGVEDITFFREPDGMVVNDIALRRRMVREIRQFQPEVVVTADPTLLYTPRGGINHPDHRAVGGAALDAVFPASGQPNLFEELAGDGIHAHKVRKVYVVSWGEGDHLVDISDTIEQKIEALLKHESQVGHVEGLGDRIRERGQERAGDSGLGYAECFRVLTIEGDETWTKLIAAHPEQYKAAIAE